MKVLYCSELYEIIKYILVGDTSKLKRFNIWLYRHNKYGYYVVLICAKSAYMNICVLWQDGTTVYENRFKISDPRYCCISMLRNEYKFEYVNDNFSEYTGKIIVNNMTNMSSDYNGLMDKLCSMVRVLQPAGMRIVDWFYSADDIHDMLIDLYDEGEGVTEHLANAENTIGPIYDIFRVGVIMDNEVCIKNITRERYCDIMVVCDDDNCGDNVDDDQ